MTSTTKLIAVSIMKITAAAIMIFNRFDKFSMIKSLNAKQELNLITLALEVRNEGLKSTLVSA